LVERLLAALPLLLAALLAARSAAGMGRDAWDAARATGAAALVHRGVALAVLLDQVHADGLVLRGGPEASILGQMELLLVAAPAKHRGVALLQLEEPVTAVIHDSDRERAAAAHEAGEVLCGRLDLAHRVLFGVKHHGREAIVLRSLAALARLVVHEV